MLLANNKNQNKLNLRVTQYVLFLLGLIFIFPSPALAFTPNAEISSFVSETLKTLTILGSLAATFFLIKGGYDYMTSSGKPDNLEQGKKTIKNALIGLSLVIGAGFLSSLLFGFFTTPAPATSTSAITLSPIIPVKPADGLTQVLLDAVTAFLQNIVQTATKPLTDGIISMLTSTPSILDNSVIWNFWLIILSITDALFVLIIALLGLQYMSASTFGFEELEFKQILPRVGLAFLGANSSIFLVDWIVLSCNKLVQALLNSTTTLNQAWIWNAVDPLKFVTGQTVLITFVFMLLFIILAVVLLLFYITRLIAISLGAVVSPLIFLLWALPKTADFAEISVKTYFVTVYTVFVHVIIIQLASAFLAAPDATGNNPIVAILIGVGLLFTLLKTPGTLMQFMFYTSSKGAFKKISSQIINIITTKSNQSEIGLANEAVKLPRRVIQG